MGVEPVAPAARVLLLDRVHPNPAREQVSMTLTLPRAGHARVRVYDGAGRLVRTLLDADLPVGSHPVAWDGLSNGGKAVPPGIYYFAARAGTERATKRVVLLSSF